MLPLSSHPSSVPPFHSRAPSSPAVSLHHLHIAVQPEDDSLLPFTSSEQPHNAAVTQPRPLHPSLSTYSSFETNDDSSHSGVLLQLHPVSVPSPLPSYPPSPSGTGSSTPTFFTSIEQQKREIALEQQAGRQQRQRHSVLASLPPQPPHLPDSPATTLLPPLPQPHSTHRRRDLSHHQTVLSSHYCSSLLAARSADLPYPLLFCVLSRDIVAEGDNFLLYSYPSSSSLPLHLLALIHTFAIVNDAADAVTAQSVRRLLLTGDVSRQQRDVVVSVHEEDDRLYVLTLTGVGRAERLQWDVRVDSLLSTLRQVMCSLYGQPHSGWFDPLLSSHEAHEGHAIDPSGPVRVPSVPASGGSFISSLLVLASSYYSLHLLDPLLRLFCHRLYSYPSPEQSFTSLCGLVAARSMEEKEQSVWRAALTRLQADSGDVESHSSQSTSTAFAVDSILLYQHGALVTPNTASVSHTLSPQLLATVTAIITLNGLLDGPATSTPAFSSSPPSSSPSASARRCRVFRLQLPRSFEQEKSSDGGEQAVLSVVVRGEWVAAALLLSRSSQTSPAIAPLSSDPYHVEPLRSLLAALSALSTSPSLSALSSCYSFSVSPTPIVVLHSGLASLCPQLYTACCRLHSSLLSSSRRLPPNNDSATAANGNSANDRHSDDMMAELAITATVEHGQKHWLRGRWKAGAGAVLLCETEDAAEEEEVEADERKECGDETVCAAESQRESTNDVGSEVVASLSRVERWFARGWQLLSALSPQNMSA